MRRLPILLLVLTVSTSVLGCAGGPRVVLIPPIVYREDGTPSDLVKIGPDMEGYVYFWDAGADVWVQSRNKVALPEGWLAAPPPPQKEK